MKSGTTPRTTQTAAGWDLVADASRQQAAAANECAAAMFRGVEGMRKVQEQAAHAAARQHTAVAARLQGPCGPGEVLAAQGEWLRSGGQCAMQYWQGLGAAALEMQSRMIAAWGQGLESAALLEAASAFDRATGR